MVSKWNLSQQEKKRLAVIVNKNKTTWTQLENYYKIPPSKIMKRIQPIAMKLQDATELAYTYDETNIEDLSDDDQEMVKQARNYRAIWENGVAKLYADLEDEYTDIYGDA